MVSAPHPPGQLDVPLMWGHESPERKAGGRDPGVSAGVTGARGVRWWELWVSYLADVGVILLCVGSAWVLAALGGAGLNPAQIAIAAVAGVEIAAFVITAALWAWRGSPGMLLANLAFAKPVALSDALVLCAVWHLALPLLGLPLLLRRHGQNVAERLGGAPIRERASLGDA